MEDTHRARNVSPIRDEKLSLNPCSNGRYSQRVTVISLAGHSYVLILVLMEDTHRVGLLETLP